MPRRLQSFLTATLFLLLTGVILGTALGVLALALESALRSLQNSEGQGLLNFLVDLFFLMIDVIAVSMGGTREGFWAGLLCAAAISLLYGLILLFFPQLLSRRWFLIFLCALTGAIVTPLSLGPLLGDFRLAAAVAGALFGLIAALVLGRTDRRDGLEQLAPLGS